MLISAMGYMENDGVGVGGGTIEWRCVCVKAKREILNEGRWEEEQERGGEEREKCPVWKALILWEAHISSLNCVAIYPLDCNGSFEHCCLTAWRPWVWILDSLYLSLWSWPVHSLSVRTSLHSLKTCRWCYCLYYKCEGAIVPLHQCVLQAPALNRISGNLGQMVVLFLQNSLASDSTWFPLHVKLFECEATPLMLQGLSYGGFTQGDRQRFKHWIMLANASSCCCPVGCVLCIYFLVTASLLKAVF